MQEERTFRKQVRMNRAEAELLERKAEATGLTQSALLRQLVLGYSPRAFPGEDFYRMLDLLEKTDRSLRDLAERRSMDPQTRRQLEEDRKRLHLFQAEMEKKFLLPEGRRKRWQ